MPIINAFPEGGGGGGDVDITYCVGFLEADKRYTYTSGSTTYEYLYVYIPGGKCCMRASTKYSSGTTSGSTATAKFYTFKDCQCDVYYKQTSETSQSSTNRTNTVNLTKGHLYTAKCICTRSSNTTSYNFSLYDETDEDYIIPQSTYGSSNSDYSYRTLVFTET